MDFQSISGFNNGLFIEATNCIPTGSNQTIDPRKHPLNTISADYKTGGPVGQLTQHVSQRGYPSKNDTQLLASKDFAVQDIGSGAGSICNTQMASPSITPNFNTPMLGRDVDYSSAESSFNSMSGTSSYSSSYPTPLTPPDSASRVSSSCPSRRESLKTSSSDNLYLTQPSRSPCPSYRQDDRSSFSDSLVSVFQAPGHDNSLANTVSPYIQQPERVIAQNHFKATCKDVSFCYSESQPQASFQNTYHQFGSDSMTTLGDAKHAQWRNGSPQMRARGTGPLDLQANLSNFSFPQLQSENVSLYQGTSPYLACANNIVPTFPSQSSFQGPEVSSPLLDYSDEESKQQCLESNQDLSISSTECLWMDVDSSTSSRTSRSTSSRKQRRNSIPKSHFTGNRIPLEQFTETPGKSKRPHACEDPNCKGNFKRPEHRDRHVKTHVPIEEKEMRQCPICPRQIEERWDNLTPHIKNTHCTPSIKEPVEEEGGPNKRYTMRGMSEKMTGGKYIQKWSDYFTRGIGNISDHADIQKRVRKLDYRWDLLLNRNPRKSNLVVTYKKDGSAKSNGLWKTIGWSILEAQHLWLRDLIPEHREDFDGFDQLTLWDIDPRRDLLYGKNLALEDCQYLGVDMDTTRALGLQCYDTRWVEIHKLTQAEAFEQGVEQEWKAKGGPAWNRDHPRHQQDTTKKESKKRKAPSELARTAHKSLEQYAKLVSGTVDDEITKANRDYRPTVRSKAVKRRNEPSAIARRVKTRLAGDYEKIQERDNESIVDACGQYSLRVR